MNTFCVIYFKFLRRRHLRNVNILLGRSKLKWHSKIHCIFDNLSKIKPLWNVKERERETRRFSLFSKIIYLDSNQVMFFLFIVTAMRLLTSKNKVIEIWGRSSMVGPLNLYFFLIYVIAITKVNYSQQIIVYLPVCRVQVLQIILFS